MWGPIGHKLGGLYSFYSPCYDGSTSDRQIVERSGLKMKCESGDTIIADRGFTVQALMTPYNIKVLIPHFTKGKSFAPDIVFKDRKLSKFGESMLKER